MVDAMIGRREVWATAQLEALGVPQKAIGSLVNAGTLFRIDRGVRASRQPDGLLALRVLSFARPNLVVDGHTAAHLYGWGR